jgi:outer membrane immunogenic protein
MTTGYNRQFGNLVAGIEAEGGYIHLTGSAPFTAERVATTSSTKIGDWYALLAGRFGVSVGPALLYAKVGGAMLNVTSDVISAPCFVFNCGSVNATGNNSLRPAWVAGGGLEYALTNSWSIKGEYLHFGTDQSYNLSGVGSPFPVPGGPFPQPPKPQMDNWQQSVQGINTAKFGLSYKFGAGPT